MHKYKGGHVCAAKYCKISSWRHKISFFRFPKDINRAKTWAIACGREDFLNDLEHLYNSYRLCGAHFEDHMFLNNLKNRLQPNATPTIFQNGESLSTNYFDHSYSATRGVLLSVPNEHLVPEEQVSHQPLINLKYEEEEKQSVEKLPGGFLYSEVSQQPLINMKYEKEEQSVEKLPGDSLYSEAGSSEKRHEDIADIWPPAKRIKIEDCRTDLDFKMLEKQ